MLKLCNYFNFSIDLVSTVSAQSSKQQSRKDRGFSLLELLLLVVFVTVLISIAVPNLVAARRSAHESRAIANLKTLVNVQYLFYSSVNRFAIVEELFNRNYLDQDQFKRNTTANSGSLTGGVVEIISDRIYDYSFRYSPDSQGFTLDADPKQHLRTSYRYFRYRTNRTTGGSSMDQVLVAKPSRANPANSAYRPLNF
ncbi:MAG: hypothetical protein JNN15_06180 [Blastocatellia bacterium]|nr:hypothetical protein [Blastocatellia bacterium]